MILRPGQCKLLQFTLTDSSGKVANIENQVLEFIQSIDIFESVFTPYIIVDVLLVDGANFVERHDLSGGETLLIEYQGYGSDTPAVYQVSLAEINGFITAPNLRSRSVSLRFTSKEYIYNSAQSIFRSYDNTTEDIVKNIYTFFLKSPKNIYVEESKKLPVVIIPYLNPFTALSFIRKRAVSISNASSPFLSFENRNGHYFVSIDYLYKNKSKNLQTFIQRQSLSNNIKGNEGSITDFDAYKNFDAYTIKTAVDVAHLLDDGGLNSVVSDYDITTKTYRRRVFTNQPMNKNFTVFADGGSQLSETIYKEYNPFVGKGYLLPFAKYKDTTNRTDNFIYDSIAEKVSFTNLLTQQKTYIDVPGNVDVVAGSIINLEVPRHNSINDKKDKNEAQSGEYLVSSVRHTINNNIDAKYSTHMELIRYGKGVFES